MDEDKAAQGLLKKLEKILRRRMGRPLKRYGKSIDHLLTPLKWKPLVLVIGNYSSGKSTFINELLGSPVQRTGQAPTDDTFTVLALPERGEVEREVPGHTIVGDERLPFGCLRRFGENLIAHLQMKRVDAPILEKLAIIDTPGMLDSVTEKDRGYDYLGVVGELAKLADLIILMFDPHKAGTIKETYQAIRSTLPGSTGRDRIIYVLNRVDECDNVADLVRSYGILCWNLSQMTGSKDVPRIFLTYSESEARAGDIQTIVADLEGGRSLPQDYNFKVWAAEREELKRTVATAPRLKLNHILQEVDRGVREFALQLEALAAFKSEFSHRQQKVWQAGLMAALVFFCFGDLLLNFWKGFPEVTLLGELANGRLTAHNLLWPGLGAVSVLAITLLIIHQLFFPRFVKKTMADLDNLIPLETVYKRDLWGRVRAEVAMNISEQGRRQLVKPHHRYLKRMEKLLAKDLRGFYERVQQGSDM